MPLHFEKGDYAVVPSTITVISFGKTSFGFVVSTEMRCEGLVGSYSNVIV